MKEERLFYDTQKREFLHVYTDKGRLIIDEQARQYEHSVMMISAE